jgi:hypothetical protein
VASLRGTIVIWPSNARSVGRCPSFAVLADPRIGQPLVRDGDGVRRLAIHMSQRHAIGIDDTIATGDRFKSPWARKAALRHGREDKLRRRWRSIRDKAENVGDLLGPLSERQMNGVVITCSRCPA